MDDVSAAARGYADKVMKIKYVCFSCDSVEVKGAECRRSGYKMKEASFQMI